MQRLNVFILAVATIAIVQIQAIPILEDSNGNAYYLLPVEGAALPESHHRYVRSPHHGEPHETVGPVRRGETSYNVHNRNVDLGHKYTFVDNDSHKFSANAHASRDFRPKGPLTTSQGAEYLHKPSGSNFQVNAENTRGAGTDVKASGTYNFFQTKDKNGRVGISGDYDRHYGGRGGNTKPDYSVVLKGSYDI